MPNRFSEFKSNSRFLTDNQKTYESKVKQLKKQADILNKEYIRLAITGEEFLDGQWKVSYSYPEDYNWEEHA